MKRRWVVVCLEYEIGDDGSLISWNACSNNEIAPGSNSMFGKTSKQLAEFLKRLQSVKNQGVVLISHHLKVILQYLKNKLDNYTVKIKDISYSFGSKIKVRDIGKLTNDRSLTKAEEMLKAFNELSELLPLDELPNTINSRIRDEFCEDLLKLDPKDSKEIRNEKKAYRANIWASNLDAPRLILLEKSTRGGLDLVNTSYVNRVIHNCYSYDATSYYPFLLETEEFPTGAGRWVNCDSQADVISAMRDFPCLVEVVYEGLQLKKAFPYLRPVKNSDDALFYTRDQDGLVGDDIVYAEWANCVIWSKEVELVDEIYSYKKKTYVQCLQFDSSMLPTIFRAKLAPYFKTKTEKKGTKEEATAKVTLNAMAGDFQMRPIDADRLAEKLGKKKTEYNDMLEGFTDEEINAELEERYNKTRGDDNFPLRRFWSYAQGKYLTMLGRVMLYQHILENEDDFIMSATDAVYFEHNKDKYFERADLETYTFTLIPTANHSNGLIQLSDFLPRKGNKVKMLGGWEGEKIEKLKVLGVKRYLKQAEGKEPELIHSGLLKSSIEKLKRTGDIWKNYNDDFKGDRKPSWILVDEPLDTREDAYAIRKMVSKESAMLYGMLGLKLNQESA